HAGVRWFVGVGDSLVYHFVSKTLSRLAPNDGRRQFLRKWGVSAKLFQHRYLRLGEDFGGVLEEPSGLGLKLSLAMNRLESIFPPRNFIPSRDHGAGKGAGTAPR
ncbi:MAG: hypothetical protein J6Y19_06120, partial [Kiritimatiellae bacterium]|nr:hypothetical protein [Kiritimatiellia bacterium]